MPAPATSDDFLDLLRKTDVVEPAVLDAYLDQLRAAGPVPPEPKNLAGLLVRDGVLTHFQAGLLLLGRTTGFTIGKYRILERLGIGGMGSVFLCEDRSLRRRVAVKVLPPKIAKDPAALARFHREAQVVGVLDHPNIVHALDFCEDDNLYYLVMEFIDGISLQEIVEKTGPLDPTRAAHYVRQAAEGLQHAHEAGLVHRDIKPGNVLVDRGGVVKILDLGLARFTDSRNEAITTRFDDQSIMGTADYLAPEQAVSLHDVDIRADIYSLGMTLYFLLAGHPPFKEGTVAAKLVSQQLHDPTPIRQLRPEVPEGLAAVLRQMIAKDPAQRYQTPGEVAQALAPFTQTPIPPPPEIELKRLSPAALGLGPSTGPLGNGPATMRAGNGWSLPEGGAARTQTMPRTRSHADTPDPSGVLTETDLKPADEEVNGRKSDRRRSGSGIQERLPPAERGPKRPADDEDVELVVEEVPAGSSPSGRSRRSDRGRKRSGPSSTRLGKKKRRQEDGESFDWRIWVGLGAGMAVLLLGVFGLFFWRSLHAPRPLSPDDGDGGTPGQRAPTTLLVGVAGGPHTYPTIRAAFDNSIPGDTILVQVDIEEAVCLRGDGGKGKDVILKAEAGPNKRVIWRAPPNHPEGEPLLELAGVQGMRVKGFHFDGQKKLNDLIVVSGRCPGTVLDELQCNNFKRCAIRFNGGSGEAERPVLLHRIRAIGDKSNEAVVFLEAGPDQPNQHVHIQESRFWCPANNLGKSAIQIAGPAADIVIQRNRILRMTDGVHCKKTDAPLRLGLKLEHNTFANLERGLHLEAMPPEDKQNRLEIKDNLFLATKKLASTDGVQLQPNPPQLQGAQLIWFDEGQAPQAAVPSGPRYFRQTFDAPANAKGPAWLNIAADDSFIVWVNGKEVGRSPPHFTRHVYRYNLANQIKPGKNVIAVQATNAPDFFTGQNTSAALLAQVSYTAGKMVPIWTDRNWKASKTAQPGWERPDFDDSGWAAAKQLGALGKETGPWSNLVWDWSVANYYNREKITPLKPVVSGNVRDLNSGEGFPPLEARGGAIKTSTDPKVKMSTSPQNDATFLRYDKDSPLAKIGSPGFPP
jgi:serine/threonine protein kinase